MARISLPDEFAPEVAPLIERIRAGRRGSLLKLYKALLHSPPLAASWFAHLGAVRWQTELDGRLRELAIIRIAHVCRVDYILRQHVPRLAEADGVSRAECDALADWGAAPFFDNKERAALAYVDAVTSELEPSDEIFASFAGYFSERQIVELTVLIGAYNMHARLVRALRIEPESAG